MVPSTRNALLISTAIVILFHVTLIASIAPVYDEQDDPRMWSIVSGGVGGTGSPMMVFSNVLIGKCLVALYAKSSTTPWYGGYLLLTQLVSHVAIFYCVMCRIGIRQGLFLSVGYFLTFGIYFHTHLQFTTVAFLAGMAGIALLIELIVDEQATRKFSQAACAAALIVWGSMIRWDSFLCVSLLALPILGLVYRRRHAPGLQGFVLGLSLALSLCLGTRWYDRAQYSEDAAWNEYLKIHTDLVSIPDYSPAELLAYRPDVADKILQRVGWSRNDYYCVKGWMWLDQDVHSPEKMAQVHREWGVASKRPSAWIIAVVKLVLMAIGSSVFAFALLIAVSAHLFLKVSASSRPLVLTLPACSVGMILFLIVYLKPPERVVVPILMLPIIVTVIVSERSPFRTGGLRVVVAILILFSGARLAWDSVTLSRSIAGMVPAIRRDYQQLVARGDRLKVLWLPNGMSDVPPLQECPELRHGNEYFLDCLQRSPHSTTVLQSAGIENLLHDMLQCDDIILISSPKNNAALKACIEEHQGMQVEEELVMKGTFIRAYQIRLDASPKTGLPNTSN